MFFEKEKSSGLQHFLVILKKKKRKAGAGMTVYICYNVSDKRKPPISWVFYNFKYLNVSIDRLKKVHDIL